MQMIVATNGRGLAIVTVSHDGRVLVNGESLRSVKPESRRKWALEQAIAYAKSHPGTDVTAKADAFLTWLDQQESPSSAQPEGSGGTTFV